MTVEDCLREKGIVLPDVAAGLGAYASWSKSGTVVTTSGQFPWSKGMLAYRGRIGEAISQEEGYQAARLCAINAVAQLRDACGGDLSRVKRILRIEGNLLCTSDYEDHAGVLDGASDLINELFGAGGHHSRAVTGVASMPIGSPVLLYVQAEISPASTSLPHNWTPELQEELGRNNGNGYVGQQLVSENERVRVWHIKLAPGERFGFHTHVLDYFWTAVTAGKGLSRSGDGGIREIPYEAGDTKYLKYDHAESMMHDLENIGDTDLIFVTVEFLDSVNRPIELNKDRHAA
jgi:enamine deaminase RidA (YjgF/YER057c/UK114 family)/quercetin dioxygenase-like cupin family protein